MTTLAKNEPRAYENAHLSPDNDLPVIASDIIYEGAAVGESSSAGTFRPLVAADNFGGFATRKADNSAGAANAIKAKVRIRGYIILNVTGVSSIADFGAAVYATDDNAFTLTSSGASQIGKVHRYITGTQCVVKFEAVSERSI